MDDRSRRIVVVGASVAGVRAAESVRSSGFDGDVVLVGEEARAPYDRPPLSKDVLTKGAADVDPPWLRAAVKYDELSIDVRVGQRATGLDLSARCVVLEDGTDLAFDSVVITTGAKARRLPATLDSSGVHYLRSFDDVVGLAASLRGRTGRVVVVGAGFIGSEVASSLRSQGLEVTVVEASPTPLQRALGREAGEFLVDLHRDHGVEVVCGEQVVDINTSEQTNTVHLSGGRTIDGAAIVVGIGADPAVDWLAGSGLEIDNGVVCDETLNCGVAGVYAAGDVAAWHNPLYGRRMRLEHWSSALEQAHIAGHNAARPDEPLTCRVLPYFWSDIHGHRLQALGNTGMGTVTWLYGDPESGSFLQAFTDADGLVNGILGFDAQGEIMKYRPLLMKGANLAQVQELAHTRAAGRVRVSA